MSTESSGVSDSKEGFESLQLPSMAPGSLVRPFRSRDDPDDDRNRDQSSGHGSGCGWAFWVCAAVVSTDRLYLQVLRFRDGVSVSRTPPDAACWTPIPRLGRKWPVWYVLITTIIQSAIGQAGRLIAAAAVLFYIFREYMGVDIPGLGDDAELGLYGFVLGASSVAIILGGKYGAVELVTKIAAGILVVSSFGVYAVAPAPIAEFVHFFQLDTPEGSWLIIASFLGLLPTGIDVSLQASEWGKAKKTGMGRIREEMEAQGIAPRFNSFTSTKRDLTVDTSRLPAHAQEYCRRWFKIALWDFRAGHVISFILAGIFLLLAAVWLFPSDVQGNAVMGEIARIFTDSVGPGMMIVFLFGAMAATYSTAFNYFDGWPRVVGACCRNLFKATAALPGTSRDDIDPEDLKYWYSEYNIYRLSMFFSLITSVLIIAGLPRPVFLVLVASALAYFVAPVIFFLNLYYCFTVIPKSDKTFYPSVFAKWFGWFSLAVFTGMSPGSDLAATRRAVPRWLRSKIDLRRRIL